MMFMIRFHATIKEISHMDYRITLCIDAHDTAYSDNKGGYVIWITA